MPSPARKAPRRLRPSSPSRPSTRSTRRLSQDGHRLPVETGQERDNPANLGQMKLMEPEKWPGHPYPLGASYDGVGTNFALFSEVAERVELCLFDSSGHETRLNVTEADGYVWHCFLPGIGPGQRYGSVSYTHLRAHETRHDL